MDHLWQSIHFSKETIRVPCICDPELVFEEQINFKEYAHQKKFDFNLLFEPLPPEKKFHIWSFMQEWLFFALIRAILQVPIRVADFVSRDDSGYRLDTTNLRLLLRQWQSHMKEMDESTAKQFITESLEILELSTSLQHGLEALGGNEDNNWAPIALSLSSLGQAFTTSIYRTFPGEQYKPFMKVLNWPASTLLEEKLHKAGWCPYAISSIDSGLGLIGAHFASLLHWEDTNVKHTKCSIDDCVAYQVDESTYKTSHIDENCCCDFITFEPKNPDLVTSILKADNTPVINTDNIDFEAKTTYLSAEPATHEVAYVAISHVWSHGLGNPGANSLPKCQLRRLIGYCRNLSAQNKHLPLYLWIDTLCIPVKGEGRKLGIAKLRDTYTEAATVLVIDATLTSTKLHGDLVSPASETEGDDVAIASAVEALLRIVVSPWTQRLWTFQEGVLGREVLFQFAEVAVSGDTLMSYFHRLIEMEVENDLFYKLIARFEFLLQRHEAFDGPHRLAALARCLHTLRYSIWRGRETAGSWLQLGAQNFSAHIFDRLELSNDCWWLKYCFGTRRRPSPFRPCLDLCPRTGLCVGCGA